MYVIGVAVYLKKMRIDEVERRTSIESKEERTETGTLWDAIFKRKIRRVVSID